MALRIGLVGRGRWSKNLARTLTSFPDVELLNVQPGDPPGALDGAIIANRSASHADAALPFIRAGMPTFIEKPMTTSVADAERIEAAARVSGATVFVGHVYLFNPAFVRLMETLPSVGTVRYVLFEGANDRPRQDSSVLWDWLPHGLSMARAIFGTGPSSVRAFPLDDAAVTEAAVVRFQFPEAVVTALVSWQSPHRRKSLTVVGSQGTYVFDDAAERKLALHRNDRVEYPEYAPDPPLLREMEAFIASIRGQPCAAVGLESALKVVRAIDAAERSLRSGGEETAISYPLP